MPEAFRDTLLHHIAALEGQLEAAKAALEAYDRHSMPESADAEPAENMRFAGMRPFDAIVKLLKEHGGRMDRDELIRALVDGGATVGKKRGHHNLRISIDVNETLGKLVLQGNYVALPPADDPPESPV